MGMVSEMHLPGGGTPGTRFNYRGMHRYLITLLSYPSSASLLDRETVRPTLDMLHGACQAHGFDLYAYCFLPDRLVLLVRGKDLNADMKQFLGAFREETETAFGERTGRRLWSRRYQERVLRKTEVTRLVAEEVFALPVKAGLAAAPETYAYQGSFVLAGVPPSGARGGRPARRGGRNFRKRGRP